MYEHATKLVGAKHEPAFYLMFKKDKNFYALVKLMYDGSLAWEHSSPTEMKTAPNFYVQDDFLYIFEKENPTYRKLDEHLVVLNATDGQKLRHIKPGTSALGFSIICSNTMGWKQEA